MTRRTERLQVTLLELWSSHSYWDDVVHDRSLRELTIPPALHTEGMLDEVVRSHLLPLR